MDKRNTGWGGVPEVIDGYPHLKHIIYLRPRGWEEYLEKINEAIDKLNVVVLGAWRKGKVHNFWRISSVNVLGVLFCK